MWTLAINVTDGVTALFKNTDLIFLIQEERLSRVRNDGHPYLGINLAVEYFKEISNEIKHIKKNYNLLKEKGFPTIIITGSRSYIKKIINEDLRSDLRIVDAFKKSPWTGENPFASVIRKKLQLKFPSLEFRDFSVDHKNHVATGEENSSLNDPAVICITASGTGLKFPRYATPVAEIMLVPKDFVEKDSWELESVWAKNSLNKYKKFYGNYGSNNVESPGSMLHDDDYFVEISKVSGIVNLFEAVNTFLNFHPNDMTKTMFLSAYGKENPNITLNNIAKIIFPKPGYLEVGDLELFKNTEDHSWHYNAEAMDEYKKDLAYTVQEVAFNRVCELVEKTIEITCKDQIIMVGKINYNYRINYKLLKRFPKIKFFHDPMSHCGADIIGAITDFKISKKSIENLYLGPITSADYNNTVFDGFELVDSTAKEISQLIAKGNIVALFQGRSEFGANALGNRSILFDPTTSNGRITLDKLKNRKWFEGYPASCLLEFSHEWFDMASLTESPYMMYAVDVLENKKQLIPNVVHKDGSCLLQTVTYDQNSNLYELLVEFNNIKNIPILLNTGFHVENEPLVETLKDAIFAMQRLDISYLWLPDIKKLAIKL